MNQPTLTEKLEKIVERVQEYPENVSVKIWALANLEKVVEEEVTEAWETVADGIRKWAEMEESSPPESQWVRFDPECEKGYYDSGELESSILGYAGYWKRWDGLKTKKKLGESN